MNPVVREGTVAAVVVPDGVTTAQRAALRVLQIGAVVVTLAAVTDRAYELDRFFVPKELTLHLAAVIAGLLAAGTFRRVPLTRIDLLLLAYLGLGAISAFLAEDRVLAARALAISVSGVAVFWAARAVREAGLSRPLLRALAVAAVLGAVTALLQTYGVQSDFFSVNRAPGGTFGNRNFVAHLAAFSFPVVLLGALRAWRPMGYMFGALGVAIVVATLILTRSRAGWLAFAAVMVVFVAAMLLSRPLRRHGRTWRRFAGIGVLLSGAIAAAILVPNSLRWRSENPYLESVAGIANFQEGSGAGRLVQYGRSMRIAIDHPILGVGPGNWSIVYPEYAAPGDPSLSRSEPGATANPWPSSDWVAFIAERGLPAATLLAIAFFGIGASALRRLVHARDEGEGLPAAALLGTILATAVAGMFDAVLLLAHPTLLVWAALGALWEPGQASGDEKRRGSHAALLVVLALAAALGAAQSGRQLSRMTIFGALQVPPPPVTLVFAGGIG
jgi:O-antigen ligase